MEEKILLMLTL